MHFGDESFIAGKQFRADNFDLAVTIWLSLQRLLLAVFCPSFSQLWLDLNDRFGCKQTLSPDLPLDPDSDRLAPCLHGATPDSSGAPRRGIGRLDRAGLP